MRDINIKCAIDDDAISKKLIDDLKASIKAEVREEVKKDIQALVEAKVEKMDTESIIYEAAISQTKDRIYHELRWRFDVPLNQRGPGFSQLTPTKQIIDDHIFAANVYDRLLEDEDIRSAVVHDASLHVSRLICDRLGANRFYAKLKDAVQRLMTSSADE